MLFLLKSSKEDDTPRPMRIKLSGRKHVKVTNQ